MIPDELFSFFWEKGGKGFGASARTFFLLSIVEIIPARLVMWSCHMMRIAACTLLSKD